MYLVVDAIQGLGQCPLDVRQTPVDLLACGAQKWLLSPWGSGFLYVRRDLIPELAPAFTGWMAFRGTDDFTRLTDYDPTFHADARRFELLTLPFQDMAGMTASLRLLLGIGIAEIAAHLRALRLPLATAADRGQFAVVSPTDPVHDSGIWCVRAADLPGTLNMSAFTRGSPVFLPLVVSISTGSPRRIPPIRPELHRYSFRWIAQKIFIQS